MISNLGKSFLAYTFSNLISSALPFILLPFLTHYLSAKDYGVLSNYTGFLAIAMTVVTINFVSAFSRQYFKKDIDIKSYVRTGVFVQLFFSLLISLVFFSFESFIVAKTGVNVIYIRLSAIYCFVFGLSEIILTQWRLENLVWKFVFFKIFRTIIEIGVTMVLILIFGMNYEGRVIGIFLATLIGFIPFIIILFKQKYVGLDINFNYLKHILKFGIPLVPHALGASIIVFTDKILISNLINFESNGIYSVSFQVALVIGLFQNSFNQAWVPWLYKSLSKISNEIKLSIVKITYQYYLGLFLLTIFLIFFTPYIFSILGKEFNTGSNLVSWIAIGFMFNGMYKMVVNYLFYVEKTMIVGTITVISALLNIVLNLIFIDLYGLKGAAIATSITLLFQFILVWFFSQRYFPMPWLNFRKLKN